MTNTSPDELSDEERSRFDWMRTTRRAALKIAGATGVVAASGQASAFHDSGVRYGEGEFGTGGFGGTSPSSRRSSTSSDSPSAPTRRLSSTSSADYSQSQ